jgi:hypothetical protein
MKERERKVKERKKKKRKKERKKEKERVKREREREAYERERRKNLTGLLTQLAYILKLAGEKYAKASFSSFFADHFISLAQMIRVVMDKEKTIKLKDPSVKKSIKPYLYCLK